VAGPTTIDSLHAEVVALRERVGGRDPIRAPELREIWACRLRPFWRLHQGLYEGTAGRFAALGENFLVIEVAAEARRFFGDTPQLSFLEALACARSGAPARCREILLSRGDLLAKVSDAPALLARTFKDAWKADGDPKYLELSLEHYLKAYEVSPDKTFPGINAASMALLAGRCDRATALAAEVGGLLPSVPVDYWGGVTLAESALVLGEIERARVLYRVACTVSDVPRANLVTTRAQARLLLPCHGLNARDFDDLFPVPNIACFTGHRTDEPGREDARFPESAIPDVSRRIAALLSENRIEIGFSSAARGGDIVFAEAVRACPRGEIHLVVPGGRDAFRTASVDGGESDWGARYDALLACADGITEIDPAQPGGLTPADFDFANRVCVGSAQMRAAELDCELRMIAVWDGETGARGGTSEAVALAVRAGIPVDIVPPRPSGHPPEVHSAGLGNDEGLFAVAAFVWDRADFPVEPSGAMRVLWDDPHCSVVFFSARAAAHFGERLLETGVPAVALHYGPLLLRLDPLAKTEEPGGLHLRRARELLAHCPAGRACASAEFAAEARLEGFRGTFEYLGRRPSPSGPDRQIFQLAE